MNMRIYGLDFTSKPKKGKSLTLAICTLKENNLTVEKLHEFGSNEPLNEYSNWLNGEGDWGKEEEWVAGIDFPFGLPLAAIQHFKWVPSSDISWSSVLDLIYKSYPTLEEFQEKIEGWKRKDKKNKCVKVHIKRQTDQIAGSTVSSPLKVRDNPPIGSMFYEGARLLKKANVDIYPVRISKNNRKVVEAYPVLAANRFVGDSKYKDQKGKKKEEAEKTRKTILQLLSEVSEKNIYKIKVTFKNEQDLEDCVSDHAGDKLDSILCATQAAWASKNGWGTPAFSLSSLSATVSIEGWIADPTLYCHFQPNEHEA